MYQELGGYRKTHGHIRTHESVGCCRSVALVDSAFSLDIKLERVVLDCENNPFLSLPLRRHHITRKVGAKAWLEHAVG
ncbi:hypothetical protein HOY82DRAFT_636614 [Tuber indicum]|nr:hypothetical protein HOY82DRAFT_636614 [Tuber indicum]